MEKKFMGKFLSILGFEDREGEDLEPEVPEEPTPYSSQSRSAAGVSCGRTGWTVTGRGSGVDDGLIRKSLGNAEAFTEALPFSHARGGPGGRAVARSLACRVCR